jgi:LuxR family maltose regulon positive regulatory protein
VTSVRSRSTRGSDSFDIPDVDLRPPTLGEGLLKRGHLIDRLDSANDANLVTMAATSRPAAWLSLGPADNDPVSLLSHLWASFEYAGMLVPDESAGSRFSSLPASDGIPRLTRALRRGEQPGLLFLDDLDSVRRRASWDLIATLIHRLDGRIQVVLASRAEPKVPIAHFRAHGLLAELSAGDLAFNDAEAKSVLDNASVEPGYELAQIMANTEGWPVGIYLTSLALEKGGGDAPSQSVRGDDLYVAEYVRHAVLDHLPEAKRSFLIRTSILDRLSGPLCDAVLETTGSERLLESLERSNLLIQRLDRTREWHRYHQMFQDTLQAELRLREPEAEVGLHERAAGWFEENGHYELSIRHAQSADDVARASRLIERIGRVTYSTGRSETVFGWLDWLQEREALYAYPAVSAMGALAAALSGDHLRSSTFLEYIEDGSHPLARLVRALRTQSGVPAMIEDARQARADFPAGSDWTPACLVVEGLGLLWMGEPERADSLFALATTMTEPVKAVPTATIALAARALIAIRGRDWANADAASAASLRLVIDHGLDGYSTSALSYVVAARLARHRNDIPRAHDLLARAVRLRPQLNSSLPGISVQTGIEMGKAHLELAEVAGARLVLRETRVILDQCGDLGVLSSEWEELNRSLETMETGKVGPASLTMAELRLLPLLASHHSFPEIGDRLYVSRHTVKTQAMSIYRKLGASSRSEAVRVAGEIGLLGS